MHDTERLTEVRFPWEWAVLAAVVGPFASLVVVLIHAELWLTELIQPVGCVPDGGCEVPWTESFWFEAAPVALQWVVAATASVVVAHSLRAYERGRGGFPTPVAKAVFAIAACVNLSLLLVELPLWSLLPADSYRVAGAPLALAVIPAVVAWRLTRNDVVRAAPAGGRTG